MPETKNRSGFAPAIEHEDEGPVMRINPTAARCMELCRYVDMRIRDFAKKTEIPLDLLRDWWMGFDDIGVDRLLSMHRVLQGAHPSPAEYILGLMERWPYGRDVVDMQTPAPAEGSAAQ